MNIPAKFKKFISDAKHVLSISSKPTEHQFNRSIKIILIGIAIIGTIGFVMAIVVSLIISGSLALI